MKPVIRACAALVLCLAGNIAAADTLETLPANWRQLVAVPQVDISPLKPDEQQALLSARSEVDQALQSSATDKSQLATRYGELGNQYLIQKLYTSADACYHNAALLAPDYFDWAYYAAYLSQQNGELQTALARYKKALELRQDYPPLQYRMAQVYLDLNRPDEARSLFEALLETPGMEAASHNGLGQVFMAQQDYRAAVEHFTRALEIDPEATKTHYPLALSLRALGDTDSAKKHLKLFDRHDVTVRDPLVDALQVLRNPARRHFLQAMAAIRNKQTQKAVDDFSAGLETEPDNAAARTSYARALYLNGDREAALTQLDRVIAQEPDRSLAVFLHAVMDDESDRTNQAVELYKRVLDKHPGHEGANFFLGNYYLRKLDYDNAIAHYSAVIRINENNTAARFFMLVAMLGNNAPDNETLSLSAQIAARAPQLLQVKRIQVLVLSLSQDSAIRDPEQARLLAEQLCKLSRNPVNLELLALSAASDGNFDKALEYMREAVELEKKYSDSPNYTRMKSSLSLLEQNRLPTLNWHEELHYMLPAPTKALSIFRDYPDPNPV